MKMTLHSIPHQKGEYHGLSKPQAQNGDSSGKGGWPSRSIWISTQTVDTQTTSTQSTGTQTTMRSIGMSKEDWEKMDRRERSTI
jgi:hypothetical protein